LENSNPSKIFKLLAKTLTSTF